METVKRLHGERLERLAAGGAGVLQYVYDAPERQADASYALALARDAFLRRQTLGSAVCDAASRSRIVLEDPALAAFSRTHPRIFEMVTSLREGARHFEVLQELGAVRSQVERGKSADEADVHVSTWLLDHCRLGPAPPEEERTAAAACSAVSRSSTPPPSSPTASS